MSKNTMLDTLAQHPRLIGFLFTTGMVLVQAGNVAANNTGMTNGP
ncbi:DUF7503 family protein [Halorussus caseinilyticus]|uniref:Uncharacterized protein n=1 Tax=Halorussus caseinilyticus TaxID=3034025 RepID=A0ABD5WKQ0_9EURY|nr:hypothetical protein [Halorussus sp. DT72]